MQVAVEIVCRALFDGFAGGPAEVPEGATVRDALAACCAAGGIGPIDDRMDHLLCMRNSRNAQFDDLVEDGDKVHILHKIMGG